LHFSAPSHLDGHKIETFKLPVGVAGHSQHIGKDHTRIYIGQTMDKQAHGVQSVFNCLWYW